ncbi:MAG: rRNA pseudouridine synthase [Treponema sp.]|nr:rRNA pseudouridine synthase [Treponema sp.]
MSKERIDKLLSHEGFGSRKDIKKLLRSCQVLVNGKQIFDPGFGIDSQNDQISVDGEEINLHGHIYLMMNKIMHTISSNKDGEHQTVFDLLDEDMKTPYLQDKLHLVGRLDMDTEGLLLFTTDGELTHRLISPKNHVDKTYFCLLEKSENPQSQEEIKKKFLEGITVGPEDNEEGFTCQSARVRFPDLEEAKIYLGKSSIEEVMPLEQIKAQNLAILTIQEGKYHQVKRMFQAVGNKVIFLKRIKIGNLPLDLELEAGEYKYLEDEDLDKIFE